MSTMKIAVAGAVAGLAMITAAGCGSPAGGDDGTSSPTPTATASPVSTAAAQRDGGHIASGATLGATAFRSHGAGAFAPGCPTVTLTGVDTDGDGATTLTALQYTDCAMMTAYGQAIVNGDEALVDNAEGSNDFNLSHAQDLQIAVQDTAGTAVNFQAANNGSHSAAGWQLDEATDVTITSADANGAYSEHDEIAWSKVYVPDSAWMPGQALVSGAYTVSGAYKITIDQGGVSAEQDFAVSTVETLQLDPACASLIVAGKIQAASGDGASAQAIEITWTGCDATGVDLVELP